MVPVLLYGCENWIVTGRMILQHAVGGLFRGVGEQGIKPAKESLQYSRCHHSRVGVCKVLIAGQETRVLEEHSVGCADAMRSMVDDVALLCLVKECKELEVLGLSSQIRTR